MRLYLSAYCDLQLREQTWRIALEERDPIDTPDPPGFTLRFLSPVYPLDGNPFVPTASDSYQIIFTAFTEPFVHIGKLSQEDRKFLWFSLGVTSVIAILPESANGDSTESQEDHVDVLCREIWEIDNGILRRPSTAIISPVDPGAYVVKSRARLPQTPDLRRVIRELDLNFSALTKRAHLLTPSSVPNLSKLRACSDALIDEMTALESEIRLSRDLGSSFADRLGKVVAQEQKRGRNPLQVKHARQSTPSKIETKPAKFNSLAFVNDFLERDRTEFDPKTWERIFERLNQQHPPVDADILRRPASNKVPKRPQMVAEVDALTNPRDFLSIAELARRWRCSRGTVYNRLRAVGGEVLDFASRGKRSRKVVSLKTVLGIENRQTKRLR